MKKLTTGDKLILLSALIPLIYSELLYFNGYKEDATFVGLWVPSILAFGIYLKTIKSNKNDWDNSLLSGFSNYDILVRFLSIN